MASACEGAGDLRYPGGMGSLPCKTAIRCTAVQDVSQGGCAALRSEGWRRQVYAEAWIRDETFQIRQAGRQAGWRHLNTSVFTSFLSHLGSDLFIRTLS